MLPGKAYKPEDFLRILWTRKWFIVIPTVLAAIGTFMWTRTLPDRYRSAATILVVPQRVPEAYVRSTVTASIQERLQTVSQQIISRTRLERVIEEFNLYRDERQTMIMEDVVEMMRRRDISLGQPNGRRGDNATSFTVSFEAPQPRVAMQVAERLASMFVQENLEDRALLADTTNQFLQAQLEDAHRRLREHEQKMEEFKQRNAGQLPTQVQSNLQMMQMTQNQIQANIDAANRERDRLSIIEGQIADAMAGVDHPLGGSAARPASGGDNAAAGTLPQQLENAQSALRTLEQGRRLKDTHPDVVRTKRIIADLEAKISEEAARRAENGGSSQPAPIGTAPRAVADKITELRVQAEQLRKSLDNRKLDDERLKRALAGYSARLDIAPKLESELTELNRDYTTLEGQYTTLLKKSEESKIALNLERRQIGEQFKIIDGARLPEKPISPDRLRLNMMGMLSGLGFGVLLIALLEYRDTTLKTDVDVVTSLALPVLAVIPVMVNATDRQRLKRRRILFACSATAVVVVGAVAALAWRLDLLEKWVR